jgi:hypothetical protein
MLEIRRLVVRMTEENPTWGYTRILGALKNVGQRSFTARARRVSLIHWSERNSPVVSHKSIEGSRHVQSSPGVRWRLASIQLWDTTPLSTIVWTLRPIT